MRFFRVFLQQGREVLRLGDAATFDDVRRTYAAALSLNTRLGRVGAGGGGMFGHSTVRQAVFLAPDGPIAVVRRLDPLVARLRQDGIAVALAGPSERVDLRGSAYREFAATWSSIQRDDSSRSETLGFGGVPQAATSLVAACERCGLGDELSHTVEAWSDKDSSLTASVGMTAGQLSRRRGGRSVAWLRGDVQGLREHVVASSATPRELLDNVLRVHNWFRFAVPASIRGLNESLPPATRVMIMLSASDDVALVGDPESLRAAGRRLQAQWRRQRAGKLTFATVLAKPDESTDELRERANRVLRGRRPPTT